MNASAIMTRPAVAIAPETPLDEVVRIMLEGRVSAVPVVRDGTVVGIVSEGDLVRRTELGTESRRHRLLEMLAPSPGQAAHCVQEHVPQAKDVMSWPVISVSGATPVAEVAQVLDAWHIKRVPVLLDGQLVGIVSRADVLRAFGRCKRAAPDLGLFDGHKMQAGNPPRVKRMHDHIDHIVPWR